MDWESPAGFVGRIHCGLGSVRYHLCLCRHQCRTTTDDACVPVHFSMTVLNLLCMRLINVGGPKTRPTPVELGHKVYLSGSKTALMNYCICKQWSYRGTNTLYGTVRVCTCRNCVTMSVSYCWRSPTCSLSLHRSLCVETFMARYSYVYS